MAFDLGFGDQDDQKDNKLSVPKNLKSKKPRVKINTKDGSIKDINEAAGFVHPSEKSKDSRGEKISGRKRPQKLKVLPKIGDTPLDYIAKGEGRATFTIQCPKSIRADFIKLREQYDQPSWVILSMLLKSFGQTDDKDAL